MGKNLPGSSATKPKFRNHKGATWDSIKVILPGGSSVEGYLDTTWGGYVYFQTGKSWRKERVEEISAGRWVLDLSQS